MKAGTPGQTVTYHNLVLSGVNAGRVSDASAQSISMALSDEKSGKISGDFGALAAHNIDLVLAGRIASSSCVLTNKSRLSTKAFSRRRRLRRAKGKFRDHLRTHFRREYQGASVFDAARLVAEAERPVA